MNEPAKSIIEAFGGVDAVAKIVGRNRASVFRWTYPKDKGGTSGLIPTECQSVLYNHAVKHKMDLKAEDFMAGAKPGAAA